jgi:hypothetical protein
MIQEVQLSFENNTVLPNVLKSKIIINSSSIYPISVFGKMNFSLRASEFIEINDGFEVDIHSEFFADVIGGCDAGY